MQSYRLPSNPSDPDPDWARLRAGLLRANADFRDANPVPLKGRPGRPLPDAPLVGSACGRLWEVRYHRPRLFAPDRAAGFTTGIRWEDPEQLRSGPIPWLYIGVRPRAFTRMTLELDQIVMRYRRAEGNLRGLATGDAQFDRRWAVYASYPAVGEVMRDSAVRQWFDELAELRPRKGDDLPTVASLGGTAILSLALDGSDRAVRVTSQLPSAFGRFLDRIETAVSQDPASRRTLSMDLVADETGYPVPTLRLPCTFCGQDVHARYQPALETDVCDRCGKSLYRYP